MRARNFVLRMLLLVVVSALAQAQVVVTDDANTSSFSPKTNYGSSIALIVCSGSNTYIKFSLANLPAGINGSNISGANAVLYVDAVLTSGTMDVYAVNGSWSEGTITYNSAPALGNKILSAVSVSKTGYLSLNLTSTVQAWLNGTLANDGIALVPSSGSSISVSFDSKENILTGHTTQLPLVLVSAGPPGPQGQQGPQGSQGPQGQQGSQGQQGPPGLQGLMGMTGATGQAGPAGPVGANGTGFNFRNAFDNSASYAVNDVVTFQGASYLASTANQGPNNPTPDQNSSAWSVMAAQGTAGTTGAPGPAGAAGPAGAQGAVGPMGPPGPPGPPPPTAALTNAANTFTTTQTIGGSLVLTSAGSGVQFADGTVQSSAATGSGGTPSGFMILGSSPTAPPGYTLSGVMSTGNVWAQVAPLLTPTEQFAAAAAGGMIYAIGATASGSVLGSVQVYNPATNSWSLTAPLPTPRRDLAAAEANGSIYAIGGLNSVAQTVGTVEVYTPATASWSTVSSMPTARSFLAAATVGSSIYAIGGYDDFGYSNTLEAYDTSTGVWTTAASMPTPRAFLAAATVNGIVYAIGGESKNGVIGTVEAYNPASSSWSTAASMPTPTTDLAVVVVNGKIYAIGGETTTDVLNTVEVYDPSTNAWSTAAPMHVPRFELAAAQANGLIYAIGGEYFGAQNVVEESSPPVTLYTFVKN
jgi:N-acetylneuraminic acid mutarotase